MKRIFVSTQGIEDWKTLLAKPEKHWKEGYSALAVATAWENAKGRFPPEVNAVFESSDVKAFRKIELLLAFPEWKVYLPPRGHPSQNDLFVLGKDADGELMTIMVEGKVAESFGKSLGAWLSTPGRQKRLDFIQSKLGLAAELPVTIRYQLLHRMVSAVIEAERFNAKSAVMLVHSFSKESVGFDDFAAFLKLFGVSTGQLGKLYSLTKVGEVEIYAGWVIGKLNFDAVTPNMTSQQI
jgi:hypothetical protein